MAHICGWSLAACSRRWLPSARRWLLALALAGGRARWSRVADASASTPTIRCGPTTTWRSTRRPSVPTEDANSYDFLVQHVRGAGRAPGRARAATSTPSTRCPTRAGSRTAPGAARPIADLVRGPDSVTGVTLDNWVVSGGKSTGVQPGFRMTDPSGQLYQMELDPPSHPELASGAEIIGTAFYHAFGYHVVEVYLAELDPGAHRPVREGDAVRPAREPAPALVAPRPRRRAAPGRPAGQRQVPRDRQPLRGRQAARQLPLLRHAPRRPERHRAARAPARAARRTRVRRLVEPRRLARHQQPRHARDRRARAATSSTTCSTSARSWAAARSTRSGIAPATSTSSSGSPGWRRWRHWGCTRGRGCTSTIPRTRRRPSGASRPTAFDPLRWKPEYPNPAFDNMRPDDAFWAARIVATFDAGRHSRHRREGPLHAIRAPPTT